MNLEVSLSMCDTHFLYTSQKFLLCGFEVDKGGILMGPEEITNILFSPVTLLSTEEGYKLYRVNNEGCFELCEKSVEAFRFQEFFTVFTPNGEKFLRIFPRKI